MKGMSTKKFNFWMIPYTFLFIGILGIVAVKFIDPQISNITIFAHSLRIELIEILSWALIYLSILIGGIVLSIKIMFGANNGPKN